MWIDEKSVGQIDAAMMRIRGGREDEDLRTDELEQVMALYELRRAIEIEELRAVIREGGELDMGDVVRLLNGIVGVVGTIGKLV